MDLGSTDLTGCTHADHRSAAWCASPRSAHRARVVPGAAPCGRAGSRNLGGSVSNLIGPHAQIFFSRSATSAETPKMPNKSAGSRAFPQFRHYFSRAHYFQPQRKKRKASPAPIPTWARGCRCEHDARGDTMRHARRAPGRPACPGGGLGPGRVCRSKRRWPLSDQPAWSKNKHRRCPRSN